MYILYIYQNGRIKVHYVGEEILFISAGKEKLQIPFELLKFRFDDGKPLKKLGCNMEQDTTGEL